MTIVDRTEQRDTFGSGCIEPLATRRASPLKLPLARVDREELQSSPTSRLHGDVHHVVVRDQR